MAKKIEESEYRYRTMNENVPRKRPANPHVHIRSDDFEAMKEWARNNPVKLGSYPRNDKSNENRS